MVKRSYSRLLYLAPLAVIAYGFVRSLKDSLVLAAHGGLCLGSTCNDITGITTGASILVPIGFFVMGWSITDRWRIAALLDKQRQAAAAGTGNVISLATLHLAEPAPLALPISIQLGMAWRSRQSHIVFIALAVIFTFVAAITAPAIAPEPGQWPAILIFLASDAGLITFVLLLGLFLFFALRERLTVTEAGLRARRFGISRVVRWHEARLFARIDSGKFELASPSGIVRFSYVQDEESLKPSVPLDRYRAEMSAVFAMIGERTGLPLIDLYVPKQRQSFSVVRR